METKREEETVNIKQHWKLYLTVVLLLLASIISVYALLANWNYQDFYREMGLINPRCGDAQGGFAFCNVGNGDSSVIYTNGAIGLVDTGTESYQEALRAKVAALTDDKLDFVVISHPHDDHAGGYEYLLNYYQVERLYIRSYTEEQLEDFAYYQRLLALSKEKGIEVIHPADRSTVQIGDIQLTFYSPVFYTDDENERCLLTMATVGGIRSFYVGDSGILTEDVLLQRGYDVKADILKIGHHGSKTSTSKAFLEKVDPAYGVICVGYNHYGHPDDQVTGLLTMQGVAFYRTDSFDKITFTVKDRRIEPVLE